MSAPYRLCGLGLLGIALALVLAGCRQPPALTRTVQPQREGLQPLATRPGQTFVALHAGLTGLELYLVPDPEPSAAEPVTVTLHLRVPGETVDLLQAQASLPPTAGYVRFEFPPQRDSHGRRYYFFLEGDQGQVAFAGGDAYRDGSRYADHRPMDGDLSLRARYGLLDMAQDLARFTLAVFLALLLTGYLFVLPGLGGLLLAGAAVPRHWESWLGLSVAVSVALYPLVLLWGDLLGVRPLGWMAGLLPGLGLLALVWRLHGARPRLRLPRPGFDLLFGATLVLVFFVRLLPVRTLPAPFWGDSVQHTYIVQLLVDRRGLFTSWEPYAPMGSFTYHFGFHTAAALWTLLTTPGQPATTPRAVLEAGQILNALSVVALVPLAVRLAGRNRWAGLAALLIGGFLSPLPAYYVNWGRYTQMAGQIVLPGLLWAFDVWWTERERPGPGFLVLMGILAAGLGLTHYRVATVAAVAGLAWALWGLWSHRRRPREWAVRLGLLAATGGIAGLAIAPWIFRVRTGRLMTVATAIAAYRGERYAAFLAEMGVWRRLDLHYPIWLWRGGILAGLLALRWRRALAIPWLLFGPLIFLATNPFLFGLPGSGWITNFLLVIALYIPLSLFGGWLLGALWRGLTVRRPWGSFLVVATWLPLLAVGARTQLTVVDPFFQMVTWSDVAAFRWIRAEIPEESRFLVNGFLAYNDSVAVGSDAGWWLPFYTQRDSTLPPLLYATEQGPTPDFQQQVRQTVIDVAATQGQPEELTRVLCERGITHVYLGQQRGRVGYGAMPLIPGTWLQGHPGFTLVHQEDAAQVWAFDLGQCATRERPQ